MRFPFSHIILALVTLHTSTLVLGQVTNADASQLKVEFKAEEIEFKSNEIVSNPLKIYNASSKDLILNLDMSYPPGWRLFKGRSTGITVAAGDSIFIPVRLVPRAKMEGNTKYSINAMIRDEDGLPMGVSSFYCFTKKVVKWDMEVGPNEKIYFKNDQEEVQFDLTLTNTGNNQQDFQLSFDGGNREDLLLMDTLGNIVRNPSYTLDMQSQEDTTLSFIVRPVQFKRNFRNVNLLTHRPFLATKEQRFRYYALSEKAKDVDSNSVKKGTKIDFIRLANQRTVSPFGSDYLPLNVEARFQNILSDFTVLSLNMNGIKQLGENRRLVYFSQLFFSQNYYNNELLSNSPWYLGYFTERWDIQAGNVSGRAIGLPANGKGFTGSYKINERHRVGGHLTFNPGFSDDRIRSYGITHDFNWNQTMRSSTSLSRYEDRLAGRYSNIASSRISMRLAQGQNISVLGAYSLSSFDDTTFTRQGYLLGMSYSGVMMDRRLRTTVNARYSSPQFGLSRSELTVLNHRANYEINNTWEIQMLNSYNNNKRYQELFSDTSSNEFTSFTNRLNFSARTKVGVFQPGVYYNVIEQALYKLHSRGLGLNYNNFNFKKNTMFSTSIIAGYNNPIQFQEIKEYFTARWTMLTRVRNLTLNLRYNYGPSNPILLTTTFARFKYPKQFRGSLQHQHLLKNTRFVLQSNASYSYNNQLLSHNVGLFPELFYFSPSGWRFSVNAGLNYLRSDVSQATSQINQDLGLQRADRGPQESTTLRMGVSVRKEIGIPIPFSKSRNHNLEFISFYDLNGNGQHDKDEPTIENVVVRVGKEEVLTSISGEASLNNMPGGDYMFSIQALDPPKGWFAYVEDSLQVITDMTVAIPFVRGIKVTGQVIIDLDQRTVAEGEKFDLSNIKVAANNGKAYHTLTDFDGKFEFFLPNGEYSITLDENILTSKYRLVQNDIPVELSNNLENMFVTFFIVEKRRKVNIKKFGQD